MEVSAGGDFCNYQGELNLLKHLVIAYIGRTTRCRSTSDEQ